MAHLGVRCKEEILRKAIVRVQDLLEKKERENKHNKAIKIKKVADLKILIQNKDEVRTEITSRKVRDKDKIKAKNQIFLQSVQENLAGMSFSNKEDHIKITNITARSSNPTWTETKLGASNDEGMQINKKAKLAIGLSIHDQQLRADVDRIINLANGKSRSHAFINFDIDMEQSINISHYWANLHKLLEIYNLPI